MFFFVTPWWQVYLIYTSYFWKFDSGNCVWAFWRFSNAYLLLSKIMRLNDCTNIKIIFHHLQYFLWYLKIILADFFHPRLATNLNVPCFGHVVLIKVSAIYFIPMFSLDNIEVIKSDLKIRFSWMRFQQYICWKCLLHGLNIQNWLL